MFALATAASAATLTVTSSADSGPGTLRQATVDALPGDLIVIAPAVTSISLTSELVIENTIAIRGGGADRAAINGQQLTRLFHLFPSATVALSHLILANGKVVDGDGGAILNDGNLSITDVVFLANECLSTTADIHGGGAIASSGTMTITRSWFTDNDAQGALAVAAGGAIWNTGTLSLTDSALWNNAICCRGGSGGAIAAGISRSGSLTTIERTTIHSNSIISDFSGVHGPMVGAGVLALFATVTLRNSVVVNNDILDFGAARDLFDNVSGVSSSGYNVVGQSATRLAPAAGDQVNLDDRQAPAWFATPLNSLNGAAVFTPTVNSPMVNAGNGTGAPAVDQIGDRRIAACAMDVGAVELQPLPTTMTLTAPSVVARRDRFTLTATVASNPRCEVQGQVEFFVDDVSFETESVIGDSAVGTTSIVLTGPHTLRAVLHPSGDYAASEASIAVSVVSSIPALSPATLMLLALALGLTGALLLRH